MTRMGENVAADWRDSMMWAIIGRLPKGRRGLKAPMREELPAARMRAAVGMVSG
jgi:hypothetical protein